MTNKILWIVAALVVIADASTKPFLERVRRDKSFDPHSDQFHCVDVSSYEDVNWKEKTCELCDATFPKILTLHKKEICEDVTTLDCNLVGYTDCEMEMGAVFYKGHDWVDTKLVEQDCVETQTIEMHKKKKSECHDVTKQNCVTKWEVLANGEKVWSGNEDCEPVTWTECKLVEFDMPFKVPVMNCTEKDEIPWKDCQEKQKTQMVSNMTCTPKTKVECLPVVKELCTTIHWTESHQEKIEKCDGSSSTWEPYQEVSHKKKCLLPDKETSLPNKPLEDLEPKENLEQNVFSNPNPLNPSDVLAQNDFGRGDPRRTAKSFSEGFRSGPKANEENGRIIKVYPVYPA
jgi:hypothetical protein